MSRSAIDMSYYIVNYCNDHDIPISNLKLQKLLYYVQATFLTNGEEAFSDEVHPWKYGPVVSAVYQEFKIYVSGNIKDRFPNINLNATEKGLVNRVIESYRDYTPPEMISKTHNEGPWKNAYCNNEDVITKAAIKDYYERHGELLYGNKIS